MGNFDFKNSIFEEKNSIMFCMLFCEKKVKKKR